MRKIHVVIDSTAHMPAASLEQCEHLHQVSLKLTLAGQEWAEEALPPGELFERMKKTGDFPRTSQPAPGDFITLFQRLVDAGGQVIVICVSEGISGTAQGARMAARAVDEKNIFVIDSMTSAVGMVRLAECALAMSERGCGAEEIVRHLHERVRLTHTLIVTDSLEYLHRGGRIGGAAALFGTILQIKPVLFLQEGKIAVLDKVRTRAKAIARMLRELERYREFDYIGVVHIEAEDDAERIRESLKTARPDVSVSVTSAGSVLGAHLGPGIVALIYQEKME